MPTIMDILQPGSPPIEPAFTPTPGAGMDDSAAWGIDPSGGALTPGGQYPNMAADPASSPVTPLYGGAPMPNLMSLVDSMGQGQAGELQGSPRAGGFSPTPGHMAQMRPQQQMPQSNSVGAFLLSPAGQQLMKMLAGR